MSAGLIEPCPPCLPGNARINPRRQLYFTVPVYALAYPKITAGDIDEMTLHSLGEAYSSQAG